MSRRRFWFVMWAPVAAFGCGAGAESSGPNPDTTDGDDRPLTGETRIAALDAIVAKANALTAATVDGRRQELIDYLRHRPEIDEAGASEDGSVWAVFTDGRPLTIIANQPESSPDDKPEQFRSLDAEGVSGGPAELPRGLQARILLGGGKDLAHTINVELGDMLRARNYSVTYEDATVDALKAVQGDAVFYIRGHGGFSHYKNGDSSYAIMTATRVTIANDIRYMTDWDSLRLGYTTRINNTFLPSLLAPFARYGINSRFVERYFSFIKDSFAYVSACSGFGGVGFNSDFRRAFLSRGAGVFWGWTGTIDDGRDNRASAYIFDRLLGLNFFEPEAIPQRPFDYESVKKDIAKKGIDKRTAAGLTIAELTYEAGPNGPSGLLAPSIKYMDVDESTNTLVLVGQFGDDPPEVRINGSPVTLRSWSLHEIKAVLPMSGPQSAGNVVVISRGRRSNTRVLSEWRPVFNIQFIAGEGTLKWEGPTRPHFRADIAPYREEAGEDPIYRTVHFTLAQDSDGDITASGVHAVSGSTTTTWSGTAHVANRIAFPSAPNVMDAIGEIETENPVMRLFFAVSITEGMKGRTTPSGGEFTIPYVWAYSDGFLSSPPLPAMFMELDADFRIVGGQRIQAPTIPSPVMFWSTTDAKYARPDTTARFVAGAGRTASIPSGRYSGMSAGAARGSRQPGRSPDRK